VVDGEAFREMRSSEVNIRGVWGLRSFWKVLFSK
jgi:hypothetical protein